MRPAIPIDTHTATRRADTRLPATDSFPDPTQDSIPDPISGSIPDSIPDAPPTWHETNGHETRQARQALVFAPPVGQRPLAGPHPGAASDAGDLLVGARPSSTRDHDATDAIADRLDGSVRSSSTRPQPVTGRVSPSAFMSGAAGLVLAAWATVGLVRAGLGRPLRAPIVEVGGFTTTAILALVVVGAGALLVLAAATRSRVVVALAGLIVTGAAVALAVEPTFGDGALGAERDFAIAVAILSGITVLVALLAADVPRRRRADRREAAARADGEDERWSDDRATDRRAVERRDAERRGAQVDGARLDPEASGGRR